MSLKYYGSKTMPNRAGYLSNTDPLRSMSEIAPSSGIVPVGSHADPYAIIDYYTELYNQQPLTYKTDPITGQVTATKSMAKPEMPSEIAGMGFDRYFKAPTRSSMLKGKNGWGGGNMGYQSTPQQEEPNLSSSWILPKGALSGESMINRITPSSDYDRTSSFNMGMGNIGQPNVAKVNPLTYWPSSAFNIPMREGGSGGKPTPQFGSVVNYDTGKWFSPPSKGWGSQDTYGKFNAGMKTSPTMGAFTPSSFIPMKSANGADALTKKKKRRDMLNSQSSLSGIYNY